MDCIPRTVRVEEPPEEVSDHRRRQDGDRRGAAPSADVLHCTVLYCTVQVLHLLGHGVQADRVAWVVPNDAWFFDRLQLDGDVYSFMRNRHISGV